ncbi:NAD-dependent epimerase/dehydratase family protein [Pigmentibacter ruber]|uniref:NAD-dependent epimerase/dehydratase family protein n=1 Tax=Pigmentibacter ruber TaxID=2683196 RepID=UPI00131EB0B0|nr:NAD(P)-dependent oxidoreductase [Pigmentibacter ruber]BFD31203.1 NAD(P)-dependent oxidoreductase [Pigmentibacter ruber]
MKNENSETKVVVFGGSGFLGSHVTEELISQGYKVKIFDLNCSKIFNKGQVEFIKADILDKQAVIDACEQQDIVYNFAGLADINVAKDNPELTAQLNIMGNLNILEACRVHQVKRFILASSVYVYSESGSFYRISKQTSEKFTELYSEKYGIPFTILRYGSLYGRRADFRNGLYRLIYQAITTGKITYSGTGEELREYIHVSDASVASVNILTQDFKNQHVVITGHQSYKVSDIMKMIAEILRYKLNITLDFANEDIDSHYNITPYAYKPRIGKKLVVNPFVDIGQGILDCIDEISTEKGFLNESS